MYFSASLLLAIIGVIIGGVTFIFANEIILLFGCPPSAVGFAVSYLKIYAVGTVFVMLAQGLNSFILTQGYSFIAMGLVLIGAIFNIILDPTIFKKRAKELKMQNRDIKIKTE